VSPLFAKMAGKKRSLLAWVVVLLLVLPFSSYSGSFVQWLLTPSPKKSTGRSAEKYIAADVPDHKILSAAGANEVMIAAYNGQLDTIKTAIRDGVNVNAQDDYGWTAIRYAVRNNQAEAALLLCTEYKADINLPSKSGRTPLMSAAGNNLQEMVRGLVNLGANLTAVDQSGSTALSYAKTAEIKDMVDPDKASPSP